MLPGGENEVTGEEAELRLKYPMPGERAHHIKVAAAKPDDPSSVPEACREEWENRLPQVVL